MSNFWLQLKKPILALAPMEGVTDLAYRTICKQWGADVVYTEFMSADAIAYGAPKVLEKMAHSHDERPVICQIFGRDPEKFALAAKRIQSMGFDGLDINFGCPAKKVVRHGSGVALLRDPQYARRLILAALENVTIPVSIKVRTSIRKEMKEIDPGCPDRYTALDLVQVIKDLPVAAMMVHGRSFELGHSGEIDIDMIQQVKAAFPGLVLANGGITSAFQAIDMLTKTGADGVGIARGSWGQPWIFQQTRELLHNEHVSEISWFDIQQTIFSHAQLLFTLKGPHGLLEFRKHFAHYIKGRPRAAMFRQQAVRVETLVDVEKLLQNMTTTFLTVQPTTQPLPA